MNERDVRERARTLADLAEHGLVADRVLEIPAPRNMEYFVASPSGAKIDSELFRISNPRLEEVILPLQIKPGTKPGT